MKLYQCSVCGQDCEVFVQPALLVGRHRAIQIHCKNPTCPNHLLTTDERDTILVDQRFIIEDDHSQDDFNLLVLERRARALTRLGA